MLSPLRELVQGYQIILASSSIQRKNILNQIGLKYTAISPTFDEESVNEEDFENPKEFVKNLASQKALNVLDQLKRDHKISSPTIVIGADCVIVSGRGIPEMREERKTLKYENEGGNCVKIICGKDSTYTFRKAEIHLVSGTSIIGKPHTQAKAIETLTSLSGSLHSVCTGVSTLILQRVKETEISVKEDVFVSETEVEFSSLSKEIIESYVATGEPLNKAGAYGIQGLGALLVKRINGDYYNVVGLPVQELCQRLISLLKEIELS